MSAFSPPHESFESVDKSVPIYNFEMSLAGKHVDPVMDRDVPDTPSLPEKRPRWTGVRSMWQDAFSEFLGTMILILFGDGVVAQVVLSKNTKGDYQSISWGWG